MTGLRGTWSGDGEGEGKAGGWGPIWTLLREPRVGSRVYNHQDMQHLRHPIRCSLLPVDMCLSGDLGICRAGREGGRPTVNLQ